jgi:hypothetical protein
VVDAVAIIPIGLEPDAWRLRYVLCERELVGDENRVELRRLRPPGQILVVADIGQRQRRRSRMPPGGLVVPAAVNEEVQVQLPLHRAHLSVLYS